MCGIAGFLHHGYRARDSIERIARMMGEAITHRGPDAGDVWVDESVQVGLSHRRLSIIDLSPAGAQPMTDSSDSHVIVYNGEVYNFDEIRASLESEGIRFKGHSDTEVILESCVRWGVHKTAQSLIGMFTFGLWNKNTRTLSLVRDRLGIKPVYWSNQGGAFVFGSELKALKQHPACPKELNRDSLANFTRFGYIPGEHSAYAGVHRLLPGCILVVTAGAEPEITSYWSLDDVVEHGEKNPFQGSDQEAQDELECLVSDAVKRRMVADVPLGAFLSGGVDSSLVVAMMQKASDQPVKTFSIGFHEEQFNEAHYAADVARHLGTEHTELYVTASDAQNVIPKLADIFDEPFGDPSQIPTYLVSAMTREHVTVALSGDGGDELFTGYNRYFKAMEYQKLFKQPNWLMTLEANILSQVSPSMVNKVGKLLPGKLGSIVSGDRVYRLPGILREGHPAGLYRSVMSHSNDPDSLLLAGSETGFRNWDYAKSHQFNDSYGFMQYLDTLNYLPDDILTKVDRASMAVSLEARVPLLDHRIVEFSWRLPLSMKVRGGTGKWILREVLCKHVPRELIDRPKKGFSVPIGLWIRTSLRDWAEDLLSEENLRRTEVFKPDPIRKKWAEHVSGKVNWQFHLWDILMMQAWLLKHR